MITAISIEENILAMYWDYYKQAKEAEGVLSYTLDKYLICLRKFNDWLYIEDTKPNKMAVQGFLADLRDKGLSPYRIRNYWVALMSFYTWADSEGILEKGNPMKGIKAPKLPKGVIQIFTDEEMDAIVDTVKDSDFEAIVTTFWRTGVRGTELLSIKNDDVDMQRQTIHIHGKGAKDRVIPFNSQCKELLSPIVERSGEYVFPTTLPQIRKTLKESCKSCGVAYRGPHCLRHTFACDYLKKGGSPLDLMHILGHSTLQMVNHYSQWMAGDRAVDNYHQLFN